MAGKKPESKDFTISEKQKGQRQAQKRGNIPQKDWKILCTKSGNRCAMPDCRKILTKNKKMNDPHSMLGEAAHIKGRNPNSARYDEKMTEKERDSYENLILVCRNCHKVMDDQPSFYAVEKLLQIKKNHEKWVIDSTGKEAINVTFEELDLVTKHLAFGKFNQNDSYTILPPKEKIMKNELSGETEQLITMGLTKVKHVAEFIGSSPDIHLGDRLKERFVSEYKKLLNEEGLKGDALFMALLDFASGGKDDFKIRAAGLGVLVYLFEKCEVFEK